MAVETVTERDTWLTVVVVFRSAASASNATQLSSRKAVIIRLFRVILCFVFISAKLQKILQTSKESADKIYYFFNNILSAFERNPKRMIRYDPPHQKLIQLHAYAFFAMHNDNDTENDNENENDTSEEVVRI